MNKKYSKIIFGVIFSVLLLGRPANAQLLGGQLMIDSIKADTAFIHLNVWENCASKLYLKKSIEFRAFDNQQNLQKQGSLNPYDSVISHDDCSPCYANSRKYLYRLLKDSAKTSDIIRLEAAPAVRDSTFNFIRADKTTMLLNTEFSSSLYGNSLVVRHFSSRIFTAIQSSTTSIAQIQKITGTNYDSIRAKLVVPQSKTTASISYPGGFSESRPMPFIGSPNSHLSKPRGFHVDTAGSLWFQPSQQGNGILCWEYSAYQNGHKILTWKREQCLKIFSNRDNSSPYLSGKNGSHGLVNTDFLIPFCDGRDSSHFFVIKDQNTSDSISIDVLNTSDKLIFERKSDTVFIQLKASEVKKMGSVIIELNDNSCQEGSKNSFGISYGSFEKPKFSVNVGYLGQRKVKLEATSQNHLGKDPKWQIGNRTFNTTDTTFLIGKPGNYEYNFSASGPGGCEFEFEDSIQIPTFPFAEIQLLSNDSLCLGDTVSAIAVWYNSIDTPVFVWNGLDTNKTEFKTEITSDTKITLEAFFGDSSQYSDTLAITAMPLPSIKIIEKKHLSCVGDTGLFLALADSQTIHSWYFNEKPLGTDSLVKLAKFGTLILKSKSGFGCKNEEQLEIKPQIFPPNNLDSITICPGEDLSFTLIQFDQFDYTLRLEDSLWKQATAEVNIMDVSKELAIYLEIDGPKNGNKCKWQDSVKIGLKSIQEFTVLGDTGVCRNSSPLDLKSESFISPNDGSWFDSNIPIKALKNGRFFDPTLVKNSRSLYSINYSTIHPETKCRFSENVRFVLLDPPKPQFLIDSLKLCAGSDDILLNQGSYATPSNGVWRGAGITLGADELYYFQPSQVDIGENNPIIYELTGENGCVSHDTVSSIVSLYPNPTASINFSIAPRTISFFDKRENISCEVNKWFWDFLDPFADACTTSVVVQEDELFCRYSISPNPPHRFRKSGIYSVKLVVEDSIKGLKDSIVKRNYLHLISSTGIQESNSAALSLSPNPAEKFTVFQTSEKHKEYSLEIFNSSGELLNSVIAVNGTKVETPWVPGFYTVVLRERQSTKEHFLKLIIK